MSLTETVLSPFFKKGGGWGDFSQFLKNPPLETGDFNEEFLTLMTVGIKFQTNNNQEAGTINTGRLIDACDWTAFVVRSEDLIRSQYVMRT